MFGKTAGWLKALLAGLAVVVLVVGALLVDDGEGAGTALAASGCQGPVAGAGTVSGVPNGWGPDVVAAAGTAGLPASVLAAQLEAESGWNPRAGSPAGAQGLAQFTPGTWASYGNGADVMDPVAAIAAQGRYLAALRSQLAPVAASSKSDLTDLVLAGYNAGPGAVRMFNGVPPYSETQAYVARIRANAARYASVDGTVAAPASTATTSAVVGCGGSGTVAGSGDDLPWATGAIDAAGPLGMYTRECVDFALWRVNQAAGSAGAPFRITNSNFRGDGQRLGFAAQWKDGWDVKGWPSGHTPQIGAVAYYGATKDNAYGHVALVKAVNPDGSFLEEGYNIDLGSGPNHSYYTRTVNDATPTWFLYIPTKADMGLAA
ncbi:surface antigen [Arthrobacter sp. GAS37]|uniref:CHAP domain-containing protein n=1 Tax=Arthrobacter sp. GAS37 TaxID=3156261 RepID=UPI00383913B1